MTHEGNPSLISLDLSYHLERDDASLRRWLVGSLVFHLVVALVALNLRFSPTIEQPLSSYEVSLVSLPALEKPTPSRSKAKKSKSVKRRARKTQPKPDQNPKKRRYHPCRPRQHRSVFLSHLPGLRSPLSYRRRERHSHNPSQYQRSRHRPIRLKHWKRSSCHLKLQVSRRRNG